jgi:hypothetical protein
MPRFVGAYLFGGVMNNEQLIKYLDSLLISKTGFVNDGYKLAVLESGIKALVAALKVSEDE